jgi:hypothetical protein
MGNWQPCPTAQQYDAYTHIVIAFAVSYTWAPEKNNCDINCQISEPPVCNNQPNPTLIQDLQAAGKKIILSFGGAGMGGSWAGDVNDCWEYCYGKETQVVDQLVTIVNIMGLDGVDIDYEYFYEDGQNGSGFSKGAQAQQFLTDVTVGLKSNLPAGSVVTHAPMDSDAVPGKAYYNVLVNVASSLDFLMPQYYNGVTRPVTDGVDGTGVGTQSALQHYTTLTNNMFGGDPKKIVFGFCINDCRYVALSETNFFAHLRLIIVLTFFVSCKLCVSPKWDRFQHKWRSSSRSHGRARKHLSMQWRSVLLGIHQ